jgi:hypothetical protein
MFVNVQARVSIDHELCVCVCVCVCVCALSIDPTVFYIMILNDVKYTSNMYCMLLADATGQLYVICSPGATQFFGYHHLYDITASPYCADTTGQLAMASSPITRQCASTVY